MTCFILSSFDNTCHYHCFMEDFTVKKQAHASIQEVCASCWMPSCNLSITSPNFLSTTGPAAQFLRKCKACADGGHHRHPLRSCAQSGVRKLHFGERLQGKSFCEWSKGLKKRTTWRVCCYSVPSGDLFETYVWGCPAAPGLADLCLPPPGKQRQSDRAAGRHQRPWHSDQ